MFASICRHLSHTILLLPGLLVGLQNERLAELCASKPDRFAAFAALTLQAPDLAVQELETAVRKCLILVTPPNGAEIAAAGTELHPD